MVELNQQKKGYAQLDERASWFYEAIANSVGMQGRTLGFGQVYLESQKDKAGSWLDGAKSYHLRVPPDPPVKHFWSFTLYDNITRGPVITPQGRGRHLIAQARPCEKCRRFGRPLFWATTAEERQCELCPDAASKGMVHILPPLRADGNLLRQVLVAA
jgi:hypothetical protein